MKFYPTNSHYPSSISVMERSITFNSTTSASKPYGLEAQQKFALYLESLPLNSYRFAAIHYLRGASVKVMIICTRGIGEVNKSLCNKLNKIFYFCRKITLLQIDQLNIFLLLSPVV